MKRRFFALRIISIIYKILAVIAFIAMIGGVAFVLLDANTFPTMQSKIQPIAAAVGGGLVGTLSLFAIAQLIDLMIALETNTRAMTVMLQRMGKVMKDRL
ncbi:MAG TPA: hypothetical protein VHD90_03345 [Phototrophicaceae bacterium]|nr:hypothetical protein [Phototrophicaceae bacterium]